MCMLWWICVFVVWMGVGVSGPNVRLLITSVMHMLFAAFLSASNNIPFSIIPSFPLRTTHFVLCMFGIVLNCLLYLEALMFRVRLTLCVAVVCVVELFDPLLCPIPSYRCLFTAFLFPWSLSMSPSFWLPPYFHHSLHHLIFPSLDIPNGVSTSISWVSVRSSRWCNVWYGCACMLSYPLCW